MQHRTRVVLDFAIGMAGALLLLATAPAQAQESTPAPGSVVVDEDAAVRALESALVRADVLLLPPGSVSLNWSLSTSVDTVDSQFLFETTDEDGNVSSALGFDSTTNRQVTTRLSADVGIPFGLQLGLSLPVGYQDRSTDVFIDGFVIGDDDSSSVAVGDLELSLQKSLVRERGFRPDLIAGLAVETATGATDSAEAGVGSDSIAYTFSLTATQRDDPVVFSGTLAHTAVYDGSERRGGGLSTRVAIASFLAASPYTSLQFQFQHEVFGTEGDGGEFRANRGSAGVLTVGGASVLGRRTSLSYSVGVGLSDTAGDYSVSLSLSHTIP